MITFSSLRFDSNGPYDVYEFMEKSWLYHPEADTQWTSRELGYYLGRVYGFHIDYSNDPFEMTLVFDDPEKELLFRLKYL